MIDTDDITPVTYINSAASLKAFCGRHGGIVCTSSNAAAVLEWSFERTSRVLFFPDQHLGRNTAIGDGHPARRRCRVWDPLRRRARRQHDRGNREQQGDPLERALQRPPDVPPRARRAVPREVPGHQDPGPSRVPAGSGRPGRRLRARRARSSTTVEAAPPGTKWAIGTELHLVNRLKQEHPEQEIHFLSPVVCMCATMYRIDLAHLCWSLENLAAGTPVNVIEVDSDVAHHALVAPERMHQTVK